MKIVLRPLILAFMLLGLAGCGLKGPLYFPPAEKTADKPRLTTSQTATQTPVQTADPGTGSNRSTGTLQP